MRTKKLNLTIAEQIAMCGVVLLGKEVLPVAFQMCHPKTKTTAAASLEVMQSRWYASPLAKAFREDIRNKLARIATTEGADLKSREGVLERLITNTQSATGKDELQGLLAVAKMQGFDRPVDDTGKEEKRTFFLPWVSNCRACALMRMYMDVQQKKQIMVE